MTTIGTIIAKIGGILNSIVPLLVALGAIYFIWGVIKYVIADSEEAKKKGKDIMIYGIIGFAVIAGMWGLANIFVEFFGGPGTIPTVGTKETCNIGTNVQDLLGYITCIINSSVIPLIFALAGLVFIWGVIKFFFINADEEGKRVQGKQFMIWGIVALAVMLSVWGLVNVLRATFNLGTDSVLPQVHPPGSSETSP